MNYIALNTSALKAGFTKFTAVYAEAFRSGTPAHQRAVRLILHEIQAELARRAMPSHFWYAAALHGQATDFMQECQQQGARATVTWTDGGRLGIGTVTAGWIVTVWPA
jgi:hypothetical protein